MEPDEPMFDHEDLQWILVNATELNRLLQQVSVASDHARKSKETRNFDLLSEKVARASKISQALADRVAARLLPDPREEKKHGKSHHRNAKGGPSHRTKSSRKTSDAQLHEEERGEPAILNPKGERELILVVDDDEQILETAAEMLTFEDYRVIVARDGLEGLRIYRRMGKEIALIILDYFLPILDGDVIFDELKAVDPNVQVVLSSGFGEQAKLGSMLKRGLRGFLPKPYTHEKLTEQIRSIIEA